MTYTAELWCVPRDRDVELPGNRAYHWDGLHMRSRRRPCVTAYLSTIPVINMTLPRRFMFLNNNFGCRRAYALSNEKAPRCFRQFRTFK